MYRIVTYLEVWWYRKVKVSLICTVLYYEPVISKVFRLARVNKGLDSFTCHPHVYPQVE